MAITEEIFKRKKWSLLTRRDVLDGLKARKLD